MIKISTWSGFRDHMKAVYEAHKVKFSGVGIVDREERTIEIGDTHWKIMLDNSYPKPDYEIVFEEDRQTYFHCTLIHGKIKNVFLGFIVMCPPEGNEAIWSDKTNIGGEGYSALDILAKMVRDSTRVRLKRCGTFDDFIRELEWMDSLLVKLMVHPRRDILLDTWRGYFKSPHVVLRNSTIEKVHGHVILPFLEPSE